MAGPSERPVPHPLRPTRWPRQRRLPQLPRRPVTPRTAPRPGSTVCADVAAPPLSSWSPGLPSVFVHARGWAYWATVHPPVGRRGHGMVRTGEIAGTRQHEALASASARPSPVELPRRGQALTSAPQRRGCAARSLQQGLSLPHGFLPNPPGTSILRPCDHGPARRSTSTHGPLVPNLCEASSAVVVTRNGGGGRGTRLSVFGQSAADVQLGYRLSGARCRPFDAVLCP